MHRVAVLFATVLLFVMWTENSFAMDKTSDYQTTYVSGKCKASMTENEQSFFIAHIICRKTYNVSDWRCEVYQESDDSFKCVQSLKRVTKFIFGSRRNILGALCGFCP